MAESCVGFSVFGALKSPEPETAQKALQFEVRRRDNGASYLERQLLLLGCCQGVPLEKCLCFFLFSMSFLQN